MIYVTQKSRGLAILLAIFLGGLGIHWFYLNKPLRGIIYLLFFWTFIPAFISILDIIYWLILGDRAFHLKYESSHNFGG